MKKLYHYRPMLTLAIFASLFAVLAEALIFCSTMVFNTRYYVWNISDSGADKALYNEINDYFDHFSDATFIPKEVYTKSFTEENVSLTAKKLARSSLEYMFGRSLAKPEVDYDFTKYENDVIEFVEKDAEERSIEKDKQYYADLENTITVSEKKVNSSFDIYMFKQLATGSNVSVLKRLVPELSTAIGIVFAAFIIMVGLMIYIDRHHPFDMPYWFGTIFFACGGVFLIPCLYLRFTGYFDGLFMEDQSIYYAITGAIYGILDKLILVNSILVALGLVLIVFAQIIHIFRIRAAKSRSHEY